MNPYGSWPTTLGSLRDNLPVSRDTILFHGRLYFC
jgi:hypothetical protein